MLHPNYYDILFIKSLADLERKISSRDHFEIMKCSALLRHLLLDSEALVNEVNKTRRLKILYKVSDPSKGGFPDIPGLTPTLDWSSIDPHGGPSILVKFDEFLRIILLRYNGESYTVKNFIDVAAHILGGVHTGKRINEKERRLNEILGIQIGGYDVVCLNLIPITKVTLAALEPLKRRILEDDKNEGGIRFEPLP